MNRIAIWTCCGLLALPLAGCGKSGETSSNDSKGSSSESSGSSAGSSGSSGGTPTSMPIVHAASDREVMANFNKIRNAVSEFMVTNSKYPPSLQSLVDAKALDAATLKSPAGSINDGKPDIWLRPADRGNPQSDSMDIIVAYDRASYRNTDHVAVLFADGHSESMKIDDFKKAMELAKAGDVRVTTPVDFQLPARP